MKNSKMNNKIVANGGASRKFLLQRSKIKLVTKRSNIAFITNHRRVDANTGA